MSLKERQVHFDCAILPCAKLFEAQLRYLDVQRSDLFWNENFQQNVPLTLHVCHAPIQLISILHRLNRKIHTKMPQQPMHEIWHLRQNQVEEEHSMVDVLRQQHEQWRY